MLIGNNSMILNQATIRAAIQHYFDTVLFAHQKAPVVEMVSYKGDVEGTFRVQVSERQP